MAGIVLWVCWGLFAAVWLAGALYNQRHAPPAQGRARSRPAVLLLAFAAVWLAQDVLPPGALAHLTVHNAGLTAAGLVILAVSTAFALWARAALGTMWSALPMAKQDHQLRTAGPYGITRHPIYTGIIGMLAGTALASGLGMWAPMLVLVVVGLSFKIRAEEQLMAATFPGQYEQYRREVPQLVPGLRLLGGAPGR